MSSPLAQVLAMASRPAPAPPQTTVAPTNVAGIYANNDSQQMDAYKQQVAQQNAMWGGLASLAGAGINAFAPGAGTAFSSAVKGGNFGQSLMGGGSPTGYGK